MVGGGLGIGQERMEVTPLQMANAMCIVANKGYFYIPHIVEKIDHETEDDSILNKFREKQEVLTHISDDVYEVVHSGMQGVVDFGTARAAKIPGINICAKTGTGENKLLLEKKIYQLKDNSMFVCFAPRENPKIAVAVIIQNSGSGASWAAPIASLLVEKYLNDTLRTERKIEVERIAGSNILPKYLIRLQFKTDSVRAADWAAQTGDSSRWKKYTDPAFRASMLDTLHHNFQPSLPNLPVNPADKPRNNLQIKPADTLQQ